MNLILITHNGFRRSNGLQQFYKDLENTISVGYLTLFKTVLTEKSNLIIKSFPY